MFLPDLTVWAYTIAHLLGRNGFLCLMEHPLLNPPGPTEKCELSDELLVRHNISVAGTAPWNDMHQPHTDGRALTRHYD
jgi:hypothetical protein